MSEFAMNDGGALASDVFTDGHGGEFARQLLTQLVRQPTIVPLRYKAVTCLGQCVGDRA